MKRKLLSLALAAVMFCGFLPTSAFAAPVPAYVHEGESTASTEVTYTIGANYEIVIPSSINLNEGIDMTITATSMNIAYGQSVAVRINANSTFENGGNFYLRDGSNQIPCSISLASAPINGLDFLVARFDDGSTTNFVTDPIRFEPSSAGAPGTYTGRLYFTITVE